MKKSRIGEKLKADKNFVPCPVETEDELFRNGFFVFNITKMNEYIQKHSEDIIFEEITVSDFSSSSTVNESHIDSVEIARPVILAEIAPGRYNVIDGNHRMEKARRMGIKNVPAYRLNAKQHMQFLTSKKAYIAYVKYWNDKVKESRR